LDVKRNDFKLDMLSAHFFMNFKVVDEHDRQLGMGRNLGALKAELGAQARGAFQALAQLRPVIAGNVIASEAKQSAVIASEAKQSADRHGAAHLAMTKGVIASEAKQTSVIASEAKQSADRHGAAHLAMTKGVIASNAKQSQDRHGASHLAITKGVIASNAKQTTWSFGEIPELMEISKGGQTLVGFPALVDMGDAVCIEVFDEPDVAAAKNRKGLARLFALQIKDALKYLEKNIPDLQKMSVAYMSLGTAEELKHHILDVALDRAFLVEPLPNDEASFKRRVDEGRGRLTLIANEVARLAGGVLLEFGAVTRKIKDTKNAPDATADCAQQLQRLLPKNFLVVTPWPQLQHCARYLKAITLRLDKYRADPARDAQRLAELKPLEQKYWRLVADRKGQTDARMLEFRWLLEELRVSFFAQELRTPQPVSVKRLEKAWTQLSH